MTRARARALVDDLARGSPPANPWAVITHDESPFIDPRVELNKPIGFEAAPVFSEQPFFARQRKIVLRNCGVIDPDQHRRIHRARRLSRLAAHVARLHAATRHR